MEILVSTNIFGFPVVNWALTETLTAFHLSQNFKILKDFSNTPFLIGDYLWSKF